MCGLSTAHQGSFPIGKYDGLTRLLEGFPGILILLQESFAFADEQRHLVTARYCCSSASLVELTLSIKVASLSSSSSSLPSASNLIELASYNAAFFNALTQGHTFGF
jgi:hypothetical protein